MYKLSYAVTGIPDTLINNINNFNLSEISEFIEFHEENEYLKQDFKVLTECTDTVPDESENYMY